MKKIIYRLVDKTGLEPVSSPCEGDDLPTELFARVERKRIELLTLLCKSSALPIKRNAPKV